MFFKFAGEIVNSASVRSISVQEGTGTLPHRILLAFSSKEGLYEAFQLCETRDASFAELERMLCGAKECLKFIKFGKNLIRTKKITALVPHTRIAENGYRTPMLSVDVGSSRHSMAFSSEEERDARLAELEAMLCEGAPPTAVQVVNEQKEETK